MALHKASYSITTDTFGYGEDDLRLRPVSSTRPFILKAVTFDSDGGDGDPSLTIRELTEDEDDDGVAIYTDGDILFFTSEPYGSSSDHATRSPTLLQPRTEAVEEVGTWISAADAGDIISTSRFVRVEVTYGGTAGGASNSTKTYTGDIYYETAGDFRF